jgi:hypothetical protein
MKAAAQMVKAGGGKVGKKSLAGSLQEACRNHSAACSLAMHVVVCLLQLGTVSSTHG